MPNLTTALPRRTGDIEEDYDRLYNWAVSLTDELKSLLCNLDSGNVTEAGSIKAQNIDASQAKIKDAQIASLTADKLTAGTIDTGQITVTGSKDGNTMTMTGDCIEFEDRGGNLRVYIGTIIDDNTNTRKMIFLLQTAPDLQGNVQRIYMDDSGDIDITGNITGASNISISNSIQIGNAIRFLDTQLANPVVGGSIDVTNNRLVILANNNRGIELSTGGNIYLYGSSLTFNDKRVLTTDDLPTT